MTRRTLMWIGAGFAVLFTIPIAVTAYHARQEEDAYREQLRLARAEGIPVTAAEYAAHIPRVPDSLNAAPFYRQLKSDVRGASHLGELCELAACRPTPETIDAAMAALAGHKRGVELAEQASSRPHCWFDRQWEGIATLFPEFADMKSGARLLGLRGSLAAFKGDPAKAVADVKRMLAIARHAGEEPHAIARLVREGIWIAAMRHLGAWALTHPEVPAYKTALAEAIASFPKPNIREEHLDEAFSVIWLVENAETKAGQEKLGLRPDDLPRGAEAIFPILLSQSKSRVKILRALRDCWAAYGLPPQERKAPLQAARRSLYEGLLAFPTAAKVYAMLADPDPDNGRDSTREADWEARRLLWTGLSRALAGKTVARSIDTHDLLSPFDGKPIAYAYDGHQITIKVRGPSRPSLILPKAP